jgi:hypothetical protein
MNKTARSAVYYAKHREAILAKLRTTYAADPVKERARSRESNRAWRSKYPLAYLVYAARRRAKRDGLAFDLEASDLEPAPALCPVFGIRLKYGYGDGRASTDPACATLDRIDNDVGYVFGNVIVVSFLANRMKGSASVAQLERLVHFYKEIGNAGAQR